MHWELVDARYAPATWAALSTPRPTRLHAQPPQRSWFALTSCRGRQRRQGLRGRRGPVQGAAAAAAMAARRGSCPSAAASHAQAAPTLPCAAAGAAGPPMVVLAAAVVRPLLFPGVPQAPRLSVRRWPLLASRPRRLSGCLSRESPEPLPLPSLLYLLLLQVVPAPAAILTPLQSSVWPRAPTLMGLPTSHSASTGRLSTCRTLCGSPTL